MQNFVLLKYGSEIKITDHLKWKIMRILRLQLEQFSIKMRYSLEPKYRKYLQGYEFLSFARKFGDKYGKKLMITATKTEINAAKKLEINMARI